jgi:hypothetical protein
VAVAGHSGRASVVRVSRAWSVDLAILGALPALLGAYVLWRGFTHVSDDDYARVVIAEAFAHAPKLDPSGTSWLPAPFWLNGAAMAVAGRSVATARAVAVALGVASVAPPYLAGRALGIGRLHAITAAALAMAVPWNVWLGVATVPEAWTGALVAAGALAAGLGGRARTWGALALLAASLARYEAWPVAAGFAAMCAWDARRVEGRARHAVAAAIAAVGPVAWMAWNAHAHGSATHFFARVAAYRHLIGASEATLAEKLTTYPAALVDAAPFVAAVAAIGLLGLRDRAARARWGRPLGLAALMVAFLIYGDVRDGAPTHHPERALVALFWILAFFGVDGARAAARRLAWGVSKRERWIAGAVAAAAIVWTATTAERLALYPGGSEAEDRRVQLDRGRALRESGARGIVVTPCAYEHFALLAAFGAPEEAQIEPTRRIAVTADCPGVR